MGAPETQKIRPQHGRHWGRCGRLGHQLHRRRGQGQSHFGRDPQNGRRLFELRLRAKQSAHQVDHLGQPNSPRQRLRHCQGRSAFQLCRCDGPHCPRGAGHRAARLGGALHRAGCGRGQRLRQNRKPVDSGGSPGRRQKADSHHPQHRDRHRGLALCAAAAGLGSSGLPDQRHAVGPA